MQFESMTTGTDALPSLMRGSIVAVRGERPVVAWGEGETAIAETVFMDPAPEWSRCVGTSVFLAFEDGDSARPIVVGFQEAPPRRAKDAKADVVRIESGKELVLECGEAKIALRADGRIEIRGGHLISRSSGPNKIKGGSVHIN